MQTLRDIVQELDRLDDEETIYTDGTSPAARAAVVAAASDEAAARAEGLRYFLEVGLAKEAVDVWSQWRALAQPTMEDKLMAIAYYATHDAYLPVD